MADIPSIGRTRLPLPPSAPDAKPAPDDGTGGGKVPAQGGDGEHVEGKGRTGKSDGAHHAGEDHGVDAEGRDVSSDPGAVSADDLDVGGDLEGGEVDSPVLAPKISDKFADPKASTLEGHEARVLGETAQQLLSVAQLVPDLSKLTTLRDVPVRFAQDVSMLKGQLVPKSDRPSESQSGPDRLFNFFVNYAERFVTLAVNKGENGHMANEQGGRDDPSALLKKLPVLTTELYEALTTGDPNDRPAAIERFLNVLQDLGFGKMVDPNTGKNGLEVAKELLESESLPEFLKAAAEADVHSAPPKLPGLPELPGGKLIPLPTAGEGAGVPKEPGAPGERAVLVPGQPVPGQAAPKEGAAKAQVTQLPHAALLAEDAQNPAPSTKASTQATSDSARLPNAPVDAKSDASSSQQQSSHAAPQQQQANNPAHAPPESPLARNELAQHQLTQPTQQQQQSAQEQGRSREPGREQPIALTAAGRADAEATGRPQSVGVEANRVIIPVTDRSSREDAKESFSERMGRRTDKKLGGNSLWNVLHTFRNPTEKATDKKDEMNRVAMLAIFALVLITGIVIVLVML